MISTSICKSIKKASQIAIGISATIVLLPLFVFVLVRTAPIQTYLVRKAASFLSREIGTPVTVGAVNFTLFYKLQLVDVEVKDRRAKPIISFKRLVAGINRVSPDKGELVFGKIALDKADIRIVQYKDDSALNLQPIIDYFSSPDTTAKKGKPWKISCKSLELKDSRFIYRDERYLSPGKGMDYSDLNIAGLNLAVSGIGLSSDTIMARIDFLSAAEQSGFRLKHLSGNAIVCPRGVNIDRFRIITDKSDLDLDLTFSYSDWNAFNNFLDSVRISTGIRPSELDMRDIACFAPEIDGMREVFRLSGDFLGTVSSFRGKDMVISFGSGTRFAGNVRMAGLPDIGETFVNMKMEEFRTCASDFEHFSLPYSQGAEGINLPDEINKLGNIIIKGRFTGFYNDFVSNAIFYTDAGNLATDVLLSNNLKENSIEYSGHIQASGFDLGMVFGIREVGSVSLDANIKGKGLLADNVDLVMDGRVTDLALMGNVLDQIDINGTLKKKRFEGLVKLKDDLASLNFNGNVDFSDSLPSFDFQAQLTHAMLTGLNLWSRDPSSVLTTSMKLNFTGSTIDNLLGTVVFGNTYYQESGKKLFMKQFLLETAAMPSGGKRMKVSSDFVDATFAGNYTFDDLSEYLTFVFTDYLPGLALVSPGLERKVKGSFDYTIQLKNTSPLTNIFFPGLEINQNTVLSGGFDPSLGLVNVNGRSPLITLNGISFHDWSLRGASTNGELGMTMSCAKAETNALLLPDKSPAGLEQLNLTALARNDSILFRLNWNDRDKTDHNTGDLEGAISFAAYPALNIRIDNASALINDTSWKIQPGNLITVDSACIGIHNVEFRSDNQSISANGLLSGDPLDQFILRFSNFNISQFDLFTNAWDVDFDGSINGELAIADIFNVPLMNASLVVRKLGFNHEQLGDAEIQSHWDNINKAVHVDTKIAYRGNAGIHYPLLARGIIYTEREHDNFDLGIHLDNIKLKVMQPFFRDLFSRMKGYGSGDFTLTGDFSEPILKGSVQLMRSEMMIDYLKTTYSYTGSINFDRGLIWFKELPLADSLGNTGTATGMIRHKAFSDWNLDIHVNAENMAVLNTSYTPDEMYYGKARVLGTLDLTGPINDLRLNVKASSSKGTDIFIPIEYGVDVSSNDFITYRQVDSTGAESRKVEPDPSNMTVNLGLNITKDATIGIILPYRMGNIRVKGDGLLDMGIDMRGDYSMQGQYVMDKGSFLFNFQDIFSRNFEISKGSTITFNGSPYDADINLKAVYKIKTNLSGLSSVPQEMASKRIPVDCIIALNNSLYNPDIRFSIAMPEVDVETQRLVYGAIDTSNTMAMNQQMISLLVLNSFTSAGESSGLAASGLEVSSFGIISGQLNNWLSQISKDFDIGINYRPGDQLTAQELELALSTQLFNDRVVIDGAFGKSTSSSGAGNQNANQWIGDVNVEVKITEDGRFRVKAFNRTNTSLDLITGQSPYTQGVGILYRKDFDNLRDLFKRQRKSIITE